MALRNGTAALRPWPPIPFEEWSASCDTLHAHSQLLGKLAVALAPPQPELQHAALRLTPRGWETAPLPIAHHQAALVAALDLRTHEAVIETSDGRVERVALTPNRSVAAVTRDVLGVVEQFAGHVAIDPRPQEVAWTVPLDEDEEHHTYNPAQVATYHSAATGAALVLAALRAPYRGRSTPVNAWWGSFDLAVSLFSGRPAEPPSNDFIARNSADAQQIEVGWWPGDARYPRAAFFGFAFPAPDGLAEATLSAPGRWDADLGEYLLDWDDVIASADPYATALGFGRSVIGHACQVCEWDPELAASFAGVPPALG